MLFDHSTSEFSRSSVNVPKLRVSPNLRFQPGAWKVGHAHEAWINAATASICWSTDDPSAHFAADFCTRACYKNPLLSTPFNLSNLSVLAVFDWLLQLDYLVPRTKHRLPWAARLAWHLTATMPCGRQRGRLGSCAVCVRKINVSLPMSMYIDIFICKKEKS